MIFIEWEENMNALLLSRSQNGLLSAIIARTIHHYNLVEELPVIGPHRLRDDPREG